MTSIVVYEEDIEVAFHKCVNFLGTVGKFVDSSKNPQFVVVNTKEHGKLWYGDLSSDEIYTKIPELANILGVEVFVDRVV